MKLENIKDKLNVHSIKKTTNYLKEKTKKTANKWKLKLDIKFLKKQVNKNYNDIGKKIYKQSKRSEQPNLDPDISRLIEEINKYKTQITHIEDKLATIENNEIPSE